MAEDHWDDPRYLEYIQVWPEPLLPWVIGESWDEYLREAESARRRGALGWDWLINGFPERRTMSLRFIDILAELLDESVEKRRRRHGIYRLPHWMYPGYRPQLSITMSHSRIEKSEDA
jgi:hypothetical protein